MVNEELQAYMDELQAARQQEVGMQMMANALASRAGNQAVNLQGTETTAPQAALSDYLSQREADRKMAIVEANKKSDTKKYGKTNLVDPATGSAVSYDETTGSYGYTGPQGWTQVAAPVERKKAGKGSGKAVSGAQAQLQPRTKGEKKKDEVYAKDYINWSDRRENVITNMELIDQTIKELELVDAEERGEIEDSGFNTGMLPARAQGRLPDVLQTEDMIRWRNNSDSIAMAKLRESLGAQFTEKEGQKLMSLAYDPSLSAGENLKRLREAKKMLGNKTAQADDRANYFETHGTLTGYKQPRRAPAEAKVEKIADEPGILDRLFGKQAAKEDKKVVRKQYSPSRNKTKIIYSDGTEEILDGKQ